MWGEEGGRLAHAPADGWTPQQDSDSGGEMEDGEVPLHLARGVDQQLAKKVSGGHVLVVFFTRMLAT